MAEVLPLRALHYDPAVVGPLADVVAPPYDVIDATQRAAARRALALQRRRRRPPARRRRPDADPYAAAAELFEAWQLQGALVRDRQPAIWAHTQDYTGPDGVRRRRRGFFCRVRVEEYGPGRVRPHERTHPGPREDRLRLMRATRADTSPIFSLYSDPERARLERSGAGNGGDPMGRGHRRRRHLAPPLARRDPDAIAAVQTCDPRRRAADRRRPPPLRDRARLRRGDRRRGRAPLPADVPRRTRGPRADRVPHPPPAQRTRRRAARAPARGPAPRLRDHRGPASSSSRRHPARDRCSSATSTPRSSRPLRLTLKDQAIADAALPDISAAYRQLDTGVLEALLLKGALGPHRRGHLPPARPALRAHRRAGARARARRRVRRRLPDAPDAGRPGQRRRRRRREHAAEVDLLLSQAPHRACCSIPCDVPSTGPPRQRSPLARRAHVTTISWGEGSHTGEIERRDRKGRHDDESHSAAQRGNFQAHRAGARPPAHGRRAARRPAARTPARTHRSCSPPASRRVRRSRWRCTPPARAGTSATSRSTSSTRRPNAAVRRSFDLSLRLPEDLPEEQVERLRVIAAKCPVHRTLDGEVMFEEHVLRVPALQAAAPAAPEPRPPWPSFPIRSPQRCSCRCFSARTSSRTPSSRGGAPTCAVMPARSPFPAAAATPRTPTCARPPCARPRRRSASRAPMSRCSASSPRPRRSSPAT